MSDKSGPVKKRRAPQRKSYTDMRDEYDRTMREGIQRRIGKALDEIEAGEIKAAKDRLLRIVLWLSSNVCVDVDPGPRPDGTRIGMWDEEADW